MIKFDICIIGAGSGGLSVAAGAAQLGLSVVLIEQGDMGGDCLNTGCVPSKSLLSVAKAGGTYRQALKRIDESVQTIAPHDSQERFESLGVKVIRASARFKDRHIVTTSTGEEIKARFFVIAAGSSPRIPDIKGLDHGKTLTNETIFGLDMKPPHLVIIGGGPIGIEMAQAHILLGCQVTIIDHGIILPKDDPDLTEVIRQTLITQGVNLYENASVKSVSYKKDMTEINIQTKDRKKHIVTGSHVMAAVGRVPNTDDLDLDKARISVIDKGIKVNKRLQTSQRHIYAIGDITGHPRFTHNAGYHAGIIIRNICFRLSAKVDYKALPWVTYTSPELAQVGLTECIAKEKYGKNKIQTKIMPFTKNDRAITEDRAQGMIKAVGLKNGKILGIGIVGDNAGELISLWGLAIQKGMKFSDITSMIIAYPTLSEISKTVAGEWYKDKLFSKKTRFIVRLLQRLPRLY